ncbi:F-box/LRR-repeat/kelch-repeat protein At1g09650-like [Cornus florida]|uniref:F-box/LRR-repeat/kelch-repeat protein At1g09650-like n=1 Tax=Cornus florida TaxID=4283 RepID=UPI00289DB698|nr:F-box/LRR-repeat/kelch-repeat protein At1g09650-like [Cornus florida]
MGQMFSIFGIQEKCCIDIHQLLPEDVVIEILLRLPVESLIRARAVCKNWYTIIINPSFVTKHFNHHTNPDRLFVNHFDNISKKYFLSLYLDETLSASSAPVYQDVVVDMPYHLGVSHYKGILCLYNHYRCALWNPATEEFRFLRVPPLNFPPNVVIFQDAFGFGLDPITNDYKVVWILDTADEVRHMMCDRKVAVYTLSTDSWRYLDVDLPHSDIETPQSNTCINGVYHWLTFVYKHLPVILSFDMGNELFHEIRDVPILSSVRAVLATYNNSLALISYDCHSNFHPIVDIWVMMEEGCWTKQLTFEIRNEVGLPMGVWKNRQLIMQTDGEDGHVALYDPETHEIKDLGSRIWAECLVYRESLVTIKGGDGFLEQDQKLSDVDQVLNFSNS